MVQRDNREPSRTDAPPPVRHGPARPIFLIVSAIALCAVLVLVVLNIDTGHERQSREMPDEGVIELIAPRALSRDDLERSTEDMRGNIQPELSKGGVVEIADPQTQQLVQRYRFASLDPNPEGEAPGWLRMRQPRFEIFLEDDRVVTIEGDSALAYRPHRAIESGTITDNVVVRLYESSPGRDVDFFVDQPTWVVTTDEASLDNFLGEIRCDDWVLIESATMSLPGKRLRLLVDDQSNRIELRVAEPEYIRLVSRQEASPLAAAPRPRRASSSAAPALAFSRDRTVTPASYAPRPPQRPSKPPQYYLLTITDDVVIKQGDLATRRTAVGDVLELVFSTQTTGLESTLAGGGSRVDRGIVSGAVLRAKPQAAYGPMPLESMISSMAMARFDEETIDEDERLLGPNITLIRCAGPLTIVPLDDSTRQLDSPEQARLELTGSPAVLRDLSNGSEARGRVLAYQTGTDLTELTGTPEHPLLVTSPEMDAGGERFFHNAAANAGGFTGAGWMTHRDDLDGDESKIAEGPQPKTELHITWQRGMDLHFGETSAGQRGGKLKSAFFDGDVRVITDEFNMDADQMTVGFTDEIDGDALDAGSIKYIHAVSSVRVIGVGNTQSIRCEDLHLDIARTTNGSTIPKLMVATGDVEAIDEDQMIWSDSLRVSFIEGDDDKAQVDELLAERDVQVLLSDGTRAFGDRLIGDGASETVELIGDDVTVISDKMIKERGKRLILDRKAGTARSPGPGSLRIFDQPVLEEDRRRIERPRIDASRKPDLSAEWTESMIYDSTTNDGAGSVDFRGGVDVVSTPTPLERNTMTGEALTLVFEKVEEPGAGEDERTREAASGGAHRGASGERGKRDVRTFIARQNAKIESQTFTTPEHDGEPNIFYIAGDHVEHDTVTAESFVAGAGRLLIHDLTPPEEGEVAASGPFGSKGTTMMQWTRELRMTRAVDEVFEIVSRGDVVLRHQDLDGVISWVTAERLDATVKRRGQGETQRATGGLDMGGSADLQRVKGTGGVVIRTDRRTVNCDEFDYDVNSGVARLIADPGRVVSIETQGSRNAVTAAEAIWDMERDSIRIIRAAGTSGN